MIYKSLHLFPAEAKEELITLLIKKYFYKLFFSWSWNVRSLVTHVLLYQLHFIHFEFVKILNDKKKSTNTNTPRPTSFDDALIKNLMKPKKKNPVAIDSDDEVHYDQKITAEVDQIGIFHNTAVIGLLKEKMEEIDFLIFYYTGKQSKKQKRLGKKSYKDEQEQEEIEIKNQFEKISKKIPKNLRIYVKPAIQQFLKENNTYEQWANQSRSTIKKNKVIHVFDHLPDINLSVPIDESENIIAPIADEW